MSDTTEDQKRDRPKPTSGAKIITKDLGKGAQVVSVYGEPSNGAGSVKNLRTRINAPATRRAMRPDPDR